MNTPNPATAALSALAALKTRLTERRNVMAGKLAQARQNVVLVESQLKQARAEADTAHGGLQGLELALGDVEAALEGHEKPAASPAGLG